MSRVRGIDLFQVPRDHLAHSHENSEKFHVPDDSDPPLRSTLTTKPGPSEARGALQYQCYRVAPMFVLTLVPRLSPTILDPARPKITSTCNGANRTLTMFILDDLSPFVPYRLRHAQTIESRAPNEHNYPTNKMREQELRSRGTPKETSPDRTGIIPRADAATAQESPSQLSKQGPGGMRA